MWKKIFFISLTILFSNFSFGNDGPPDWGNIGGSSGRSRAFCIFDIINSSGEKKRSFKVYSNGKSYYLAKKSACRKSFRKCEMFRPSYGEGHYCKKFI
jgi:hypothetical protein